eukprot:scaffold173572_cov52-Prasinocladus_malaysianus.AAC.1
MANKDTLCCAFQAKGGSVERPHQIGPGCWRGIQIPLGAAAVCMTISGVQGMLGLALAWLR